MKTILVYLDGGIKSGWQDKVLAAFEDFIRQGVVTLFDPRKNPKEPEKYRLINEENWKKADIIFAYSESSVTCTIFVDDLKPKILEYYERIEEEKGHKDPPNFTETISRFIKKATSLAEGIDILKNEIDAMIIRKSNP